MTADSLIVEVDEASGQVVAVSFRSTLLPFVERRVNTNKARERRASYWPWRRDITAISVFSVESYADEGSTLVCSE